MKRYATLLLGLTVVLGASKCPDNETKFVNDNMQSAGNQVRLLLKDAGTGNRFPRTINNQGKLVSTSMYDWTPGFFPGSLWYSYEYSQDPALKQAAIQWTEKLEPLRDFKDHHDLGFMMYCSYGNAYRLTGKEAYRENLIRAARSLCTRFDAVTGCIKSWNSFKSWHGDKTYNFPVIIDNMMNLELLFFATRVTGDSSFYKVAVTHANTTLKNHFRKDFSSYHVVCYDTLTGKVLAQETAQGYADNSTWSRGHAWAIYGYTMSYRETQDPKYLDAAIRLADWYLNNKNLPADKVPLWDFNVQEKGYTPGIKSNANVVNKPYRDASAAAITCSALFELSTFAGNKNEGYRSAAISTLHSLAGSAYRADANTNGNFLLRHSVGSIPHDTEIDVPLVYADYYFLEAMLRYKKLLGGATQLVSYTDPIYDRKPAAAP
jgi:chondroitin AC lyase